MTTSKAPVMEGYPDHIWPRLEVRNRNLKRKTPSSENGVGFELVFEDLKRWEVGFFTVSFDGGDAEMYKKIANVASRWFEHDNIGFDFWYDENTWRYRELYPVEDVHIRVGFSYPGYRSLVATDSTDPDIISYSETRLNLSRFDQELPVDWDGTVLQQFGHSLGFHHEHQSPEINDCKCNWDFLYDYLGGAPSNEPKWKVDHNMPKLPGGDLT